MSEPERVMIGDVAVVFDDDGSYVPRARRTSEEMKPTVERRMARIDELTPEQRMVVPRVRLAHRANLHGARRQKPALNSRANKVGHQRCDGPKRSTVI